MRNDEPALVFAREKALEALEERHARGLVSPDDNYLMGLGQLGLGHLDEGARLLLEAAETNETDIRQAIESARALDERGLSMEAIVVLRAYLDGQTGDPIANLEHVRLLIDARNPTARDAREALAVIDLLLPENPDELESVHLPFRVLKVDALEALGRREDAERLLLQLARAHRDDEEVARRVAEFQLSPR
jgi:hypothetical protein